MIKDIVGGFLSIVVAFLLVGITPLYYVGIIQWASSSSQALAYTRAIVDEVIDTKELSDDSLEDYNIKMAALPNYYEAVITRQVKIINPLPGGSAGETYTTYAVVDDNRHYDSGDLIVVEVKQIGLNRAQAFARGLLGLSMPGDSFTIPGRVR